MSLRVIVPRAATVILFNLAIGLSWRVVGQWLAGPVL